MAKILTASQSTLALDPSAQKTGACSSLVESTAPETSKVLSKVTGFQNPPHSKLGVIKLLFLCQFKQAAIELDSRPTKVIKLD